MGVTFLGKKHTLVIPFGPKILPEKHTYTHTHKNVKTKGGWKSTNKPNHNLIL